MVHREEEGLFVNTNEVDAGTGKRRKRQQDRCGA
jgi:hypothetical protein